MAVLLNTLPSTTRSGGSFIRRSRHKKIQKKKWEKKDIRKAARKSATGAMGNPRMVKGRFFYILIVTDCQEQIAISYWAM